MSREELEKLTAIKLRELAQQYEEITGTSAMKKEELIVAILKARGEPVKEKKKKVAHVADIKKAIRSLRVEKAKALTEKNRTAAVKLRKKIKKLKRQTRQLADEKKK